MSTTAALAATVPGVGDEVAPYMVSLSLQASAFASRACAVLSAEEAMLLRMSLMRLQVTQNLSCLSFFGRVSVAASRDKDYYLAYALPPKHSKQVCVGDALNDIVVYFCQDAKAWAASPSVTASEYTAATSLRDMFTGDPAYEAKVPNHAFQASVTSDPTPDAETFGLGSPLATVQEAKRLTVLVRAVLTEAGVAPRGAYLCDDGSSNLTKSVRRNYTFCGVQPHLAESPSAYVQTGRLLHTDEQLGRTDFTPSADIFESLEKAKPLGSWTIHRNNTDIFVSSLVWPGQHMVCSMVNGSFSSVYFGNGRKNLDIGFML